MLICFTLSRTSARFALLNRSTVPTRYPVIRRMRSNFTPSPTLPFTTEKESHLSFFHFYINMLQIDFSQNVNKYPLNAKNLQMRFFKP